MMLDNIDECNYFNFTYTADKSVGLYNNDVNDVYHSIYGAKTEGWEKFVLPLDFEKIFSQKGSIKVLDICFGIGYNTKALLKKILHNGYTGDVKIDALEYDKNLVLLSPFVKDRYFKSYPEISYILFCNLYEYIKNDFPSFNTLISDKSKNKFLEPFYLDFIKKYPISRYNYDPLWLKKAFVHNIYYQCISQRNKRTLKHIRNANIKIKPHYDDARKTIKSLNTKYDIIFLDAFTPTKLPTLWSYDFFKELFRLCNDSSILVTYSNSAAVRHAMIDAGFFVGKLHDKHSRQCGTIASTNKSFIKSGLDDYDLGLINTNAGLYYRDENLSSTAEEIISEYNERRKNSNLESSSQYIKRFKQAKGKLNE